MYWSLVSVIFNKEVLSFFDAQCTNSWMDAQNFFISGLDVVVVSMYSGSINL